MSGFSSYEYNSTLLPTAFFMTDEKRCPDPLAVVEGLPEDCGVIFRDYRRPGREQLAARVAALCKKRGLVFLIAGDLALMRNVNADGLHLPEWALQRHPGVMGLNAQQILTVSAHNPKSLHRAATLGADAALIAPAFETDSHKGRPGLGLHRLQRLARTSPVPFYVLGGITEDTMKRLPPDKKMAGVAGISLFMK